MHFNRSSLTFKIHTVGQYVKSIICNKKKKRKIYSTLANKHSSNIKLQTAFPFREKIPWTGKGLVLTNSWIQLHNCRHRAAVNMVLNANTGFCTQEISQWGKHIQMGKAESRQQSGKPNNTLEKQLKTAIEKNRNRDRVTLGSKRHNSTRVQTIWKLGRITSVRSFFCICFYWLFT